MTKLFAAGRLCALLALAAFAFNASSYAQPAPAAPAPPACTGETVPTQFGVVCLIQAPLPDMTGADYGAVRLRFRPGSAPNEIIPEREIRGSYLSRLFSRIANQQVNSAAILVEVRVSGPGLPVVAGTNGANIGVPIALVPLAVYSFENRTSAKFNIVEDYADRVIGSRFLLQRDQTIHVRTKISFSHENPSSLIASLAPIVSTAAGFGGHGFLVDAFATQSMVNSMTSIEGMLRSANNLTADADRGFNLNYDGGPNRLTYDIRLNPRQSNTRNVGRLEVTLERRPSLFTEDVLPPGADGERRPNYHTGGGVDTQATERIWTDIKIANGQSPGQYVAANAGLRRDVEEFQSRGVSVPNFDTRCRSLREDLNAFGLSRHDRAAVFWAAFVQGDSATRQDIQEIYCIKRDRDLWAKYGFALPPTSAPPPAVPSQAVVDDWIYTDARPALWSENLTERVRRSRRLFRPEITVNIGANTLYEGTDIPAVTDGRVQRDILISQLKPLRVECRFIRQEPGASPNLPRFSVLGWLGERVLVLTVDYAGVVGNPNGVEITALRIANPVDADWQAIAGTPNIDRRCLRDNALRPQAATPAAGGAPPAASAQPGGQPQPQPTQR